MGNADKKPLISIIVPVYNTECFLRKCVDSIIAQTYDHLEIILIDDGSTDQCPAICDEYAERDARIRVIHKENGGLSDARNAGLEAATGEWLSFVDSDDMLSLHALELLHELAEKHNAELVIGGNMRFVDDDVTIEETDQSEHIMTKTEAMTDFFKNGCAAWARLYKKAIHTDVPFPVGEINEDEAIVLRLLDRCETVIKTDQIIYCYRIRPESITTSSFSRKKLDWYRHCKANLEWIRENHPELEAEAAERYRSSLLWSLTEIALADGDYRAEIKMLLGELKAARALFKGIPYMYSTDRLRAAMLTYLPFAFYKMFIRIKRTLR